jgi:glycosyltransferase involved in cell wall biosynthesis
MVRILFVHHGKGIGGAPLSLLYLIRGLDKSIYKPTVLCIHKSEASDMFEREGLETIVMSGLHDFSHTNVLWYPWWQLPKIVLRFLQLPLTFFRFGSFLRSHPFDLIHLNTSTLIAFGWAAHRQGVKVVWHVREPVARGYIGLRRAMVRSSINSCADAIIPICRHDASQLIASDRIKVVYNFVDFAVFDAKIDGSSVRAELGIDVSAPMILMLGGINPIKGTREFVIAALEVLKHYPDAVFVVAGGIPSKGFRNLLNGMMRYWRDIQELIPAALAANFLFAGVRKDIPKMIAACTIVCFPSTVPHFARPIIEASAMGKPVVASDLGGPKELVLEGETGLLVPARDPARLAGAMERLLAHPVAAQAMGTNGTAFARKHFDAVRNTNDVIRIYKNLMSGS